MNAMALIATNISLDAKPLNRNKGKIKIGAAVTFVAMMNPPMTPYIIAKTSGFCTIGDLPRPHSIPAIRRQVAKTSNASGLGWNACLITIDDANGDS